MTNTQILLAQGVFQKPGSGGNPATGQTITGKLSRRLKDYELMAKDPKFNSLGYHKPGSLKK